MKKINILITLLIILVTLFCGCNDDENRDGLVGDKSDFIGTWVTEGEEGAFSLGNSIRFNNDDTCEFFWEHSSIIRANGSWQITINTEGDYILIIKIGEIETSYAYDFFYNYKTLRLKEENSNEYVYYNKR